jgi:hypothetical protein
MASIEDRLAATQVILTRYILLVCFILGIFGNICNICIFIQKKLRVNSCSIYFIAASFINFLIIIFGITPTISASYIADPTLYFPWACKLKLYGLHSLLMMSRSYILLACIDQYTFCSPNAGLRRFSRRQIALKLVCAVPFIWLIVPIHMLIFVDIQKPSDRCGTSGVYSIIYSIYSFVCALLPLILMVIFSSMVFYNLRQVLRRVQPGNDNQMQVGHIRFRKYDYQIMIMLLCEVIVYLISTILHPITTLYMSLTTVSKGSPPISLLGIAIEGFMAYLAWGFLIYLNSCSTFYINYCVSKVFRSRFYSLISILFNWFRCNQERHAPHRHNVTGRSIRGQHKTLPRPIKF